ncbi:2 4-dihydroxyhept-2-ene-1 7-dioic acid aldolase [Fusarium mundagurra]|uniref:2 4-dihydroxyhept-2-ene-1 7-dioic acid aldolase n=1 Tax=Fusarium mundagurra TaxID=1567541 RepID=A0A8H5YFZ7_9HYPO|nr:2 4-dihydroxyhept-2-ene-1 7-dioic acid aldolase [Fusarium mundagurra]
MSFKGKVIAITGAASGIGLATAKFLASEGAILALSDTQAKALQAAQKEIASTGTESEGTVVDVRDRAAVEAWAQKTVQRFGKLDGLVTSAGVVGKQQMKAEIHEINDDDWDFVMDVNVRGTLNSLRAFIPSLNTGASIVTLASYSGLAGMGKFGAYVTSKHAVVGLSRTATAELGPKGIRVNCVCPGPIETPILGDETNKGPDIFKQMAPLQRLGQPIEVAKLVHWLLSDGSSYVTGTTQVIDGGFMNRLKVALEHGRTAMGAWQMIRGANVSRILARSGVDWVVVDCEHGNIDDAAMHEAVPTIAAVGVSPIVRLPDMQGWMVKRALDSGAHGIIVPMLRTVEEAKQLVQDAKFPPYGKRGFGSPMAPERFIPVPTFTEYLQQANDALLTIVQIETREALEAVDDIAAVEGIDALFLGPFDLGIYLSLFSPKLHHLTCTGNNIGHPIINGVIDDELEAALAKSLKAAKKARKKCGIYCTSGAQAKAYAEQGFDMMNVITDYPGLEFAVKQQLNMATGKDKPAAGRSY